MAETWDGELNDINGFHVKPEHVFAALDGAKPGPVAEGNVGGGTGMIVHEFKGGTGTSVQATEEAIINAMIAAETMEGVNGNTVYAIPR